MESSAPHGEPAPRAVPRLRGWQWALGLVVTTGGIAVLMKDFDLGQLSSLWRAASLPRLACAVTADLLVVPALTQQWSLLVPLARRPSWPRMWKIVSVSVSTMNVVPFGGGHALGVGLLAGRGALGIGGALSVMALEQVCEGMAKCGVVALALVIGPVPPSIRTAAGVLAVVLLAIGGIAWAIAALSPAGGSLRRLTDHFEALRRPGPLALGVLLGFGMKAVQMAAIYAVQRSLHIDLPFASLPLILAATGFATMLSVAPANLGIYEAAAYGIYRWLGVPPAEAVALAILHHLSFLAAMIVPGYFTLLVGTLRRCQGA